MNYLFSAPGLSERKRGAREGERHRERERGGVREGKGGRGEGVSKRTRQTKRKLGIIVGVHLFFKPFF